MNKITFKEVPPEKKTLKSGDLLVFSSGDDGVFMLVQPTPGRWFAVDLQDGGLLDAESSPADLLAAHDLEPYRGSVTITTVQSR